MCKRIAIKLMMLITLIGVVSTSSAQSSNSIFGIWKDVDHPEKQVEIVAQNERFIGKSINSPKPEENGKIIFKDLTWSEVSKSYKGILVNPDNGEEFKVELTLIGTDKFTFTVGKFIFFKTFVFKRVSL